MSAVHVFMEGKNPVRLRLGENTYVIHTGSVRNFDLATAGSEIKQIIIGEDYVGDPPDPLSILDIGAPDTPIAYFERPSDDGDAAGIIYNVTSEPGSKYAYLHASSVDPDFGALVAGVQDAATDEQVVLFSDIRNDPEWE